MILTGKKIIEELEAKKITITPFDQLQIDTNSYNFRLGSQIKCYKNQLIDPKKDNETVTLELTEQGIVLEPNKIYLGHTVETMGSKHYVPIIRGRSSTGRIGLFIHITADLIDIGSINQWTLMMHAVQPVRVYPNMLIGQVTFWVPTGDITLYNGKYQGSKGPVASKVYLDF